MRAFTALVVTLALVAGCQEPAAAWDWRAHTRLPVMHHTGRRVTSTAYCLTGTMANGQRTYRGAVASNDYPLGTRLRVTSSPWGAGVFTVADRIGHGTQLDFAMPNQCSAARAWGRRTVVESRVD